MDELEYEEDPYRGEYETFDGLRFREKCEGAAEALERDSKRDPSAANRARIWAEEGGYLIDNEDFSKSIRYLLATIGNLADQNAVNTQAALKSAARKILVPLWASAALLAYIAYRLSI